MKILVLDNYDSFVYNLVHIIRELGYDEALDVYRNDKIEVAQAEAYDKILLSPGPGIPSEAGIMIPLIEKMADHKSILGICLGHQAIGEVFGAELINLTNVYHGVGTPIHRTNEEDYIFQHVPVTFNVCRYHSWAVKKETIHGSLAITALDEDQIVMGLRHKEYDVRGLQFHPESILTEHGKILIKNWLEH
ncbi:MAG: aminodeoxychorismate/anthranilate synthase component II [Cyclobacteriaceae bacterium]|nr:aminodeoxychorismate/anthranilate synthase component II [Cyclobacteriaceae bacterium]